MKEFLQLASNSIVHGSVHFLGFTKHGSVAVMVFLVTLEPSRINPYFSYSGEPDRKRRGGSVDVGISPQSCKSLAVLEPQ